VIDPWGVEVPELVGRIAAARRRAHRDGMGAFNYQYALDEATIRSASPKNFTLPEGKGFSRAVVQVSARAPRYITVYFNGLGTMGHFHHVDVGERAVFERRRHVWRWRWEPVDDEDAAA
jgi:hypothetical protein